MLMSICSNQVTGVCLFYSMSMHTCDVGGAGEGH